MSDELKDFRDALKTTIEADTTLTPELIAGSVVKAPGLGQPEDIDTIVKTTAAKAKGLALVLYNGAGRNLSPLGEHREVTLGATQLLELYAHRAKWNQAYQSAKRTAESVLFGVIKLLHLAEISNPVLACYETFEFDNYAPVQDPDFEVWQISFVRRMNL